jgi:hypothetical protein
VSKRKRMGAGHCRKRIEFKTIYLFEGRTRSPTEILQWNLLFQDMKGFNGIINQYTRFQPMPRKSTSQRWNCRQTRSSSTRGSTCATTSSTIGTRSTDHKLDPGTSQNLCIQEDWTPVFLQNQQTRWSSCGTNSFLQYLYSIHRYLPLR